MMSPIALLNAREEELERQMVWMTELIDHETGEACALELELQLSRVVGQWRAMLVLRDRLVYRPAVKHPDGARATMAAACQQRMDALAEQVEEFARRWSSSALITTAFPSFRATALVLLAAMTARLDRERRLLGDLVAEPARLVA